MSLMFRHVCKFFENKQKIKIKEIAMIISEEQIIKIAIFFLKIKVRTWIESDVDTKK